MGSYYHSATPRSILTQFAEVGATSVEMHHLFWVTAAALLFASVSAFYPYNQRVPIKRVFIRRDSKYNVVTAAKPSQSDSAGVNQDGTDYTYFSSFTFGDGKQSFNMLVDSGASNTWVMGSDCKSDVCNAHNTFGTDDSSSLKVSDNTFGITYGTGSVEGVVGSDTVHFAGFNVPLSFGLGNNVSTEFLNYPMDGIVGLGRGDTTEPAINAPTFMDALKSAGAIKAKLYGLSLWRESDGGTNDGEISFGSADHSKYSGSLSYISIIDNPDGFWEIPIGDASVNGKSLGLSQRSALIDSGTSFILMPSDDAQKLHGQIPGSQQNGERYTLPCNWQGTVSLTLNGITYDISYKDIVYQSSNQCISNVVGRQTFGPDQWLVGDVFMKNVYTVFDFDGSRLGFGKKSASSEAPNGSPTTSKASLAAPAKTSAASGTLESSSSDPQTEAQQVNIESFSPSSASQIASLQSVEKSSATNFGPDSQASLQPNSATSNADTNLTGTLNDSPPSLLMFSDFGLSIPTLSPFNVEAAAFLSQSPLSSSNPVSIYTYKRRMFPIFASAEPMPSPDAPSGSAQLQGEQNVDKSISYYLTASGASVASSTSATTSRPTAHGSTSLASSTPATSTSFKSIASSTKSTTSSIASPTSTSRPRSSANHSTVKSAVSAYSKATPIHSESAVQSTTGMSSAPPSYGYGNPGNDNGFPDHVFGDFGNDFGSYDDDFGDHDEDDCDDEAKVEAAMGTPKPYPTGVSTITMADSTGSSNTLISATSSSIRLLTNPSSGPDTTTS